MTAFLAWVFSQASKVYDWFGNAYYALKNAAVNAWNWAVDRAHEAFLDAIDWAWAQVQATKVHLLGLLAGLQQLISDVRNGLVEDLTSILDWVEWKFMTLGDFASGLINQALDGVYALLANVQAWVESRLDQGLEWVRTTLFSTFAWLLDIRERILDLISVFTKDRLQALITFLTSGLGALTAFISNPVTFILDIIQDQILGFLAYVLAWSLGTTNNELPRTPPWRK